MTHWKAETKSENESIFLKLGGHIAEGSSYPVLDFSQKKSLEIDFDGIDLINSIGIQRWIIFIKQIPEQINIIFSRCPTIVINQIEALPDFTAKRKIHIKSFYAPFYCAKCDLQQEIFLDEDKTNECRKLKAPPTNVGCPTCGESMEFDDVESSLSHLLG